MNEILLCLWKLINFVFLFFWFGSMRKFEIDERENGNNWRHKYFASGYFAIVSKTENVYR